MKINIKSYTSFIFLILILYPYFTTISGQSSSNQAEGQIILIDNSHDQFINSSLLTLATNFLSAQGFNVIATDESEGLSPNALNGIDLLIIPNFGQDAKITNEEKSSIKQWLSTDDRGLILLTNPHIKTNSSLNGYPQEFNILLSLELGLSAFETQFTQTQGSFEGVQIAKIENTESSTIIDLQVDESTALDLSIENEEKNRSILVKTHSSAVKAQIPLLKAGYDSFAINSNNQYILQNTNPVLIGGEILSSLSDNSRLVLGGSTIMFSDILVENNNLPWFNQKNNDQLLLELVNWVLNTKGSDSTIDDPVPFTDWNLLLFGMVIISILLILGGLFTHKFGKEIGIFEMKRQELQTIQKTGKEESDSERKIEEKLTRQQKRLRQRVQSQKKQN